MIEIGDGFVRKSVKNDIIWIKISKINYVGLFPNGTLCKKNIDEVLLYHRWTYINKGKTND